MKSLEILVWKGFDESVQIKSYALSACFSLGLLSRESK